MGGESVQAPGVTASDALRLAVEALQAGRHDPRLPDGAQANALESIAWSLIGLLAKEAVSQGAPLPAPAMHRSLTEDLRRAGFVHLDGR